MADIAAGRILGRCRLEQPIGQGAMGVVWEARHLTLDIPVAVKVLRGHELLGDNSRQMERFRREARMAARINHPGLVRVLDFGEDDGVPFLVMELVRGQTLDQYLRRRGELSETLALQVVLHLVAALAVAHGEGIVHRDLKPSNILLDAEGHLKISDLGLARDGAAPAITGASGVVGTPHFIAPECLEGNVEPDHRSDLYAVGVLLYLMLSGRHPFEGSTAQILQGHARQEPDWDAVAARGTTSGSLAILRRLLEKKPGKRPASALELAEAVRAQLVRIQGDRPSRSGSSRIARESGVGSSEFRLKRVLENQLGTSSSLREGANILHTSWNERLLVWILLGGLVAIGLTSWLVFG